MEQFYPEIESYIAGELEGDHLKAFEAAIKKHPALAAAVEQHREMNNRLRGLALRKKVERAVSPLRRRGGYGTIYWTLSAAAAFALLIAAFWFWSPGQTDEIAQVQPQKTEIPPITDTAAALPPPVPHPAPAEAPSPRYLALAKSNFSAIQGGKLRDLQNENNKQDIIYKLIEYYEKKEYNQVIKLSASIPDTEKSGLQRALEAQSYFELGKYQSASAGFLALSDSFQFKFEAQWNYALCRLALGDKGGAKRALSGIISEVDHPFYEKAQILNRNLR